jgi:signal transduction histidine kinase
MKKHIMVPVGLCLCCVLIAGYYANSVRDTQIDAKKELITSYASNIITQIEELMVESRILVVALKPLIAAGLANDRPAEHSGVILQMEDFYAAHTYIKNIAIYDQQGNVFNITRDDGGKFIKDPYKSRSVINVLHANEEVIVDRNGYSFALPVFDGETLAGNVSIGLDFELFQQHLCERFIKKTDVWITSVLALNSTFSIKKDAVLTNVKEVISEMETHENGFCFGHISEKKRMIEVVSYYERLPYSGHFFGVIVSGDISRSSASLLNFLCLAVLLFVGLTIAIISALQHISQRFKKENKEKDYQLALQQSICQNMPFGIMLGKENKLVTANDFALKFLSDFMQPSDIGARLSAINFPANFIDHPEDEKIGKWNLVSFESHGRENYLLKNQSNITVDNELHTVILFADVSESEQARKNIIRSDMAKAELLHRISVAFKRPLNEINDTVAILTQQYPKEPTLSHITTLIDLLTKTIANIHDFSNIEAGNVVLEETSFDVGDEIQKTLAEYQTEAQRKNITLRVQIAPTAVRKIVGDAKKFKQILTQLLRNAVKFTDEGEVKISLETIPLDTNKTLVRCSVEDTGKGMSKEQLKNLFSIVREKGVSIGLGTVIAKQLVTIMGGDILVTSPSSISTRPEAPGSQFCFTIACYIDCRFDKRLDFSSITAYTQLNVLVVTNDERHVQYQVDFMKKKGICTNMFVVDKETKDLLSNKLIIDKGRYQIIFIGYDDSKANYDIATALFKNDLTKQHLFVLLDTSSEQKGNYLRAKALQMDYYCGNTEDVSVMETLLKAHFPNL